MRSRLSSACSLAEGCEACVHATADGIRMGTSICVLLEYFAFRYETMASEPSPSDSLDWGAAVDDEFYDYEENATRRYVYGVGAGGKIVIVLNPSERGQNVPRRLPFSHDYMSCEDETVVMSWLVNIDRLKIRDSSTRDDALAHLLEIEEREIRVRSRWRDANFC